MCDQVNPPPPITTTQKDLTTNNDKKWNEGSTRTPQDTIIKQISPPCQGPPIAKGSTERQQSSFCTPTFISRKPEEGKESTCEVEQWNQLLSERKSRSRRIAWDLMERKCKSKANLMKE
eukprot:500806-Ditylum_brightwellii.AAC.1